MQVPNLMLAAAQSEKINHLQEIYDRLAPLPNWGLEVTFVLTIFIAAAVVVIFTRQKKIAQNQVDLARMIEQLIEK